jgi:hypothetical protein
VGGISSNDRSPHVVASVSRDKRETLERDEEEQ